MKIASVFANMLSTIKCNLVILKLGNCGGTDFCLTHIYTYVCHKRVGGGGGISQLIKDKAQQNLKFLLC